MPVLRLEADERTGMLVDFVTQELDDTTLDQIDVEREIAPTEGLASEPVTVAVTLTLGTTAIVAVLRIVERWLESQRQMSTLTIVAEGFEQSDEAGKQLAALARKHAHVSTKYGLARESWRAK